MGAPSQTDSCRNQSHIEHGVEAKLPPSTGNRSCRIYLTEIVRPCERSTLPTMLAKINAVAAFVNASRAALFDEDAVRKLQSDQVQHLQAYVQGSSISVEEGADVLTALKSDVITGAFAPEQRAALASAIAAATTGATSPPSSTKVRPDPQTHYHMAKYLTKSDWDVLQKQSSLHEKLDVLVNRSLAIGLLFPSELSVTSIVSIIKVVSKREVSASDMHSMVVEYKRLLKLRRPAFSRTALKFQEKASDFMVMWPGIYTDPDLPVEPPFDDGEFDRARSSTAARKSHKTLTNVSGGGGNNSSSSSTTMSVHQLQALASALMQQSFMRHGDVNGDLLGLRIFPRPQQARAPLALTDGPLALTDVARESQPSSEDAARPSILAGTTGVKPSIDAAMAAVQAAIDAKANGKKKGKKGAAGKAKAAAQKGKADGAKPEAKAVAKSAMKRPAAAAAAGNQPSVQVVRSRSNVVARTGLPGEGMSKCFRFESEKGIDAAKKAATEWLRGRCEEVGVECRY